MRAVAGSVSAGTRQRAKQEHQTPVSPPFPLASSSTMASWRSAVSKPAVYQLEIEVRGG